jgi:hypothetical protein
LIDKVWDDINSQYDGYLSGLWEDLCRKSVPFIEIDGKRFNPAARWWEAGWMEGRWNWTW